MTRITFIGRDGAPQIIDAQDGQSVLQAAWEHRVDLEGSCEGNLACATCHVWVEGEGAKPLEKPKDDELDMLDLAQNRRKNSRLACQLKVSPALEGLTLRLPPRA